MFHPKCSLNPHCHILVRAQDIKPWAQASTTKGTLKQNVLEIGKVSEMAHRKGEEERGSAPRSADSRLSSVTPPTPHSTALLTAPDVTRGRNPPSTSVELGPQLWPALSSIQVFPAPHSKGVSTPKPHQSLLSLTFCFSPTKLPLYPADSTWHYMALLEGDLLSPPLYRVEL